MTATVRITAPAVAISRPTGIAAKLSQMVGVYRQRRQLARLDDAALNDIGISRDAAALEADRPFWDV